MNWKFNVLQTAGKVRVMNTYDCNYVTSADPRIVNMEGSLWQPLLQKINISVIDLAIHRK